MQCMLCQVACEGDATLVPSPRLPSSDSRWRHGTAIARQNFADTGRVPHFFFIRAQILIEDLFHVSGQKFTPDIGGRSDADSKQLITMTWYEFLAHGRLSSSLCTSVRKQKNSTTAAGLALEPDSSSMLEIYVGIRAGGSSWCIAVRIITRAMC